MSMFTLAISCLITSNLPWVMDLTFQVPMQYCSLQHQTLLPSQVTFTTRCCFCFGSISSFFLELFFHWFPVAYWAPTDLGSSSFSVLSFCLFMLFTGFSRQEYWSGLPFPFLADHVLSELSTMTILGGPTRNGLESPISQRMRVMYLSGLWGLHICCPLETTTRTLVVWWDQYSDFLGELGSELHSPPL